MGCGDVAFWVIVGAFAVLLPGFYLSRLPKVPPRNKGVMPAANHDLRRYYTESVKLLVSSAGIAIAVLAAGLKTGAPFPPAGKVAAIALLVCIVFAMATLFELSRAYEKAGDDTSDIKIALPLGYVALAAFLLGFSAMAKVVLDFPKPDTPSSAPATNAALTPAPAPACAPICALAMAVPPAPAAVAPSPPASPNDAGKHD
jgi:uncharacterized membrane protein